MLKNAVAKSTYNKYQQKPWFTEEVKVAAKDKRDAYIISTNQKIINSRKITETVLTIRLRS